MLPTASRPELPRRSSPSSRFRAFDIAAQRTEIFQHPLACRIALQPPAHPLEQRLTQGIFEFLQHLGGGRLGQTELGRCRAQGLALVDGQYQGHLAHAQPVQQLWRVVALLSIDPMAWLLIASGYRLINNFQFTHISGFPRIGLR